MCSVAQVRVYCTISWKYFQTTNTKTAVSMIKSGFSLVFRLGLRIYVRFAVWCHPEDVDVISGSMFCLSGVTQETSPRRPICHPHVLSVHCVVQETDMSPL